MWSAIGVVLLALLSIRAQADPVTELPGLSRATLSLAVTSPDGASNTLETLVIRPDGPGPFPLALISHGMPRSDIPATRPQSYSGPAIAFAQHGYAAVIVMRRGYGHSTGTFAETLGPCNDRNYISPGKAAAADVLGALEKLRQEPWVDPKRVLLVGLSMGGFAVVAASAANPAGVRGTLSFAGAAGSPRPDYVCQPNRLIQAAQVFGKTAHVPSHWIFAENDHYFGPALARQMFDAYVAAGAPASFFAAPPIGKDGHLLFFAPAVWWPQVAPFLESLQLPTQIQIELPPATALAAPVPLDEAGQTAFAQYVPSRSYEKAFATDADGHYGVALGHRTKAAAGQAALKDCQRMERVCSVYAVGNEIAALGATRR
jgi:dienelactone hydrolase